MQARRLHHKLLHHQFVVGRPVCLFCPGPNSVKWTPLFGPKISLPSLHFSQSFMLSAGCWLGKVSHSQWTEFIPGSDDQYQSGCNKLHRQWIGIFFKHSSIFVLRLAFSISSLLTHAQIPGACCVIPRSRDQGSAITAQGQTVDSLSMSLEDRLCLTSRHIPDPCCVIE